MSQTNYGLNSSRPGLPGLCVDLAGAVQRSALATGAVAQVSTVTVDSATNSQDYVLTVTFGGTDYSVTYTSDGTATTSEIASGLSSAVTADANINAFITPSISGASPNVLTLTGRYKGESFTFSVTPAADVTLATGTAAAAAGAIPFGRACVLDADNTDGIELPDTANDTLKVVHATPTAENNAIYDLSLVADLDFDGINEVYTASYSADGSADVQEIVEALQAALDAQMPANTIAITEDDAKLIFTSELPNLDFNVTGVELGATATWTITTDTDLVPLRFKGVSLHSHRVETDSDGATQYSGGDVVSLLQKGDIWVEVDDAITPALGDPVFVRASASGSEVLGAFRDSQDGADCIFLPPSICQWIEAAAYNVNEKRIAKLRIHRTEV
tara:strand:- start:3755 stop:4918 length:1164 start_codon:yes stop_codon:yes gene_type:complete